MDNDFFPTPSPDAIPLENSMVNTQEDQEELQRRALAAKRTTIFLWIVAVILFAFIVWELVDIMQGGRP